MAVVTQRLDLSIPVSKEPAGTPPGYTLAQHQTWPANSTYNGPAKLLTAELQAPSAIPSAIASKIIEVFVEQFKTGGYSPLEISVYKDANHPLYINYKVEFKVYDASVNLPAGSGTGAVMHLVQAIAVIVVAIAAAIVIIGLTLMTWKVSDVIGQAGPLGGIGIVIILILLASGFASGRKKEKTT